MALSADEAVNWLDQVEEVTALDAIFAGDFTITCLEGGHADQHDQLNQQQQEVLTPQLLAEQPEPRGPWRLHCHIATHPQLPPDGLQLRMGRGEGSGRKEDGIAERPMQGAAAGAAAAARSSSWTSPSGAGAGAEEEDDSSGGGSGGAGGGFRVSHLPPIDLHLRFSPHYPSAQPPEVEVGALWLRPRQARQLRVQLLKLWEEQGPGAPIAFVWHDWLQTSALEWMGVGGSLSLGLEAAPSGSEGMEEGRLSEHNDVEDALKEGGEGEKGPMGLDPETLLLRLLRYDAARRLQVFQRSQHTCGVCYEDKPGTAFARGECGHAFCIDCLRQQVRVGGGRRQREGMMDCHCEILLCN